MGATRTVSERKAHVIHAAVTVANPQTPADRRLAQTAHGRSIGRGDSRERPAPTQVMEVMAVAGDSCQSCNAMASSASRSRFDSGACDLAASTGRRRWCEGVTAYVANSHLPAATRWRPTTQGPKDERSQDAGRGGGRTNGRGTAGQHDARPARFRPGRLSDGLYRDRLLCGGSTTNRRAL